MEKIGVKVFITELLNISHTQSLFCNITLHDKCQGILASTKQRELIAVIKKLHATPIEAIPPESRLLLSCDLNELKLVDDDYQEQWIEAFVIAQNAGLHLWCLSTRCNQLELHK